MKRFLSLALAAVCLTCFIAPAFAAEAADIADYTVAGKLFKQLWACLLYTSFPRSPCFPEPTRTRCMCLWRMRAIASAPRPRSRAT